MMIVKRRESSGGGGEREMGEKGDVAVGALPGASV